MESVFNMVDCKIVKTAVCEFCGGTAKFSMIKKKKNEKVEYNKKNGFVSTDCEYFSVCGPCHKMP